METPTLILGFEYLSKAKEIEYTQDMKEQITLIRERFGISSKYKISLGRQRGSLLSEYDDKSWKCLINLKGGEPPIINVVANKSNSAQHIDTVDIVEDSEDELFIPSPKPKREQIHSASFRPHLHPHISQRPPRHSFGHDDNYEDDDYVADRTYTSGSRKHQPNTSSGTDKPTPPKPSKGRLVAGPENQVRCTRCLKRGKKCFQVLGNVRTSACIECKKSHAACSKGLRSCIAPLDP